MKVAFLLKGFYRLDNTQSGIRFTFTGQNQNYHFNNVIDNFYENVYIPLNNTCDCDWYFVTYEDIDILEFKTFLLSKMPLFKFILMKQTDDSTAIQNFYYGVKHIADNKKYDRYIFARNDLEYKKTFDTFLPVYDSLEAKFFYLFKELTHNDDRISDNIFIVDNNVELFILFLEECLSRNDVKESKYNLHNTYEILVKYFKTISSLIDGCYDNDTSYNYPFSNNPVYKFANRPYYF